MNDPRKVLLGTSFFIRMFAIWRGGVIQVIKSLANLHARFSLVVFKTSGKKERSKRNENGWHPFNQLPNYQRVNKKLRIDAGLYYKTPKLTESLSIVMFRVCMFLLRLFETFFENGIYNYRQICSRIQIMAHRSA